MFTEKNLPKLIILTPIITIIILFMVILYYFIKSQNDYFVKESHLLEQEYINKQKVVLQNEVSGIFDYINYHKKLMIKNIKKDMKLQMQAFIYLLEEQTNDEKYMQYINQNVNARTDFLIYDKKKLLKNTSVFFNMNNLINFQKNMQTKKQSFIFVDETDLYLFKYLKNKDIIIILKKDIFYNMDDLKYSIARWVEFIRFGRNNYFWIHSNTNKLIAHPYRQEDINKDDTHLKDGKGTFYIQQNIKLAMKNHQGNFSEYYWNKPKEKEKIKKLSFVKLYKEWNWVIGTGIYMDEIQKVIITKKKRLEEKIDKYIEVTIGITILLLLFMSFLSVMVSQKINKTFKGYQDKVHKKELKLKDLNQNLHSKIALALKEAQEKDRAMLHQSRLARMGKMLNMISHQWRQPLSQLAGIMMELETTVAFKKANNQFVLTCASDATKIIQFMSLTIDDFKNFFKPEKNKEYFYVSSACNEAISLIKDSLINENIRLHLDIKNDKKIKGYKREYAQVILNFLVNAKDALLSKKIKDAHITLSIDTKDNRSIVSVKDNAQGIIEENMDLIFEPYFSTKKAQGTGLGLYMAKMIIETNMQGKLSVHNDENGAVFKIVI
ncbi:MAG: cache domain-containing protein [Campylobacteraceae bacterium]|nr:cache domain-containing protein [Campylobacteraceae bacterium]